MQLVSIIVPVYNIEKYLEHCIKSILAQTYKNIELILVNDGSIDNSSCICEKFAALDSRIKMINKMNGGLSSARNAGMNIANGEWILFVDGDDWLEEDCINRCINVSKEKTDIIMFPYIREYKKQSRTVEMFEEKYREFSDQEIDEYLIRKLIGPINEELAKPNRIEDLNPVWSKLYRRSIIKDIKFVDTKKIGTEDLWFNIQAFQKSKRVIYTKTTYYHYNKTNDNALTRKYNIKLFPGWIQLYSLIENFISEKFNDEIYIQAFNNRKVINLLALIRNIVSSNLDYQVKRMEIKKILSNSQYIIPFEHFDFSHLPFVWKLFYKSCMKKNICIVHFMVLIAEHVKQYS